VLTTVCAEFSSRAGLAHDALNCDKVNTGKCIGDAHCPPAE
jgi:hypothetical protein